MRTCAPSCAIFCLSASVFTIQLDLDILDLLRALAVVDHEARRRSLPRVVLVFVKENLSLAGGLVTATAPTYI